MIDVSHSRNTRQILSTPIKEFPDKGWAFSSLNTSLNYLNILPACFASFFLASSDVIAEKILPFQIS